MSRGVGWKSLWRSLVFSQRGEPLWFGGALLLCIALVLVACAPPTPPPRRLVYGLTLAPSGIDPHINASAELGIPLTSVYDTLIYQDPESGDFVPGLAESWEISEDGRVYTFHLRRDVTFHDGTPFNAQAVKANLDRIAAPETRSQKAVFMLGPYERTEVIDEYTVAIHLREPFAPLLDSLSQVYLGMASPDALRQWGPDYQFHQVGTGPFKFVEYVPNDHLTIARNPDYRWGPSVFANRGTAYLDEVIFRFYTDPATRAMALESGEVHVMGEVPPLDARRLSQDERFKLYAVPIPGQPLQFFFNTAKSPTDDLRVRQALIYATDREAIVNTVFGGLSPVAHGPLTRATPGYDPAVEGMYPYDPERAKALLDEAGWREVNGMRQKDGQPLRLEAVIMGWGYVPEVVQLLQAQWQAIGVELTVQQVPYGALLEAGRTGAVHLIPFLLSGTDPDLLRSFFHSGAAFNWSKVSDPELDEWLGQASRLTNWDQRSALYGQVQRRIMEQALVLPIRDYVNLNVASARVKGLRYDARGWFPWLVDVSLEP
ncbi:MAG TPA: ABC transporter substrate-binding protein [Caldilineae bacterium]|nr:ABC transporter substrate-binding protein [Caldilineae bacterium]